MPPRFFERKSRSDCVHEQVAKLGPVSRAAGMDCKCPLYYKRPETLILSVFPVFCKKSMRQDLNLRPLRPERSALPS